MALPQVEDHDYGLLKFCVSLQSFLAFVFLLYELESNFLEMLGNLRM